MKIIFPNFHYDLLKQMSYIFGSQLGWTVGLMGANEFAFFNIEKAMSDPDGFDRISQQHWIADALHMELCDSKKSVSDADLILVTTPFHYNVWTSYAKKHHINAKIIFYCGNGDTGTPPQYHMDNFWTANYPAYCASKSRNKIYWQGIFCDAYPDYQTIPSSPHHEGFASFVNRIQEIYPASYDFIKKSQSIYNACGGEESVFFYGQRNAHGMLNMGKYGNEDEVYQKMANSIAVLHIKDTDAPGFTIMRALALGKPLIVTRKFIDNTQLSTLLNENTCIIVDTPEDMSKAMLSLDNDISARNIGVHGAVHVHNHCTWSIFQKQFIPWLSNLK